MKVLPVRCLDRDSGTDVRGDKGVIENCDTRQRGRPGAVLKNKRRTGKGEDDMRRICRTEAPALVDQPRLTRVERAQDRRDGRLASAVLRIEQGELRQRELSASVDRIKLSNVSQQ